MGRGIVFVALGWFTACCLQPVCPAGRDCDGGPVPIPDPVACISDEDCGGADRACEWTNLEDCHSGSAADPLVYDSFVVRASRCGAQPTHGLDACCGSWGYPICQAGCRVATSECACSCICDSCPPAPDGGP